MYNPLDMEAYFVCLFTVLGMQNIDFVEVRQYFPIDGVIRRS